MGKTIVIDKATKQSILDFTERLLSPGDINLGWDDIKSVLLQGEEVVIAFGCGSGQNRILKACEDAVCNYRTATKPRVATGVLFHLTGPENLMLWEVNEAIDMIKKVVCSSVELTFGVAHDSTLKDEIRIIVLATHRE